MIGRILFVDDTSANVRPLSTILQTDVMTPGIDGSKTCRRIKADGRIRHLPVIMVSAFSAIEDWNRGLEASTDDFLGKPIDRHPDGTIDTGGWILVRAADPDTEAEIRRQLVRDGHVGDLVPQVDVVVDTGSDGSSPDSLWAVRSLRLSPETEDLPIVVLLPQICPDAESRARLERVLDLGVADGLHVLLDPVDLLARPCGEEFVAVVRTPSGPEGLHAMADRSYAMVVTPVALASGLQIPVTIGFSAAILAPGRFVADVYQSVDTALYAVQAAGRNQPDISRTDR